MSVHHPRFSDKTLESELNAVCQIDPGLISVLNLVGLPATRSRPAEFETLAKIINAQQLSTKAAAAIWSRLERNCRGKVTPRKILNRDMETLKSCGISKRKSEYVQGLAQSIVDGTFCLDSLTKLPDDDLIVELTKIKGLGRWSAEIFAMFAMDREDIFPAGDLALRVAVQRYARMRQRPDEEKVRKFAKRWSPHQSAVALLMWKYYGATTLE